MIVQFYMYYHQSLSDSIIVMTIDKPNERCDIMIGS